MSQKETAYVNHRYGKHHTDGRVGKMRTKRNGKVIESTTKKVMVDKFRYVQTRFCGEDNKLYTGDGEALSDYKEAWDLIEDEANNIARSKTKGRSKNTSFIFDSTINTGDGRMLSFDDLHKIAGEFIERLRESGYKIGQYVYCIHDNGNHRHIHISFVSHKTIQKSMNGPMRSFIRKLAEKQKALAIEKDRGREI